MAADLVRRECVLIIAGGNAAALAAKAATATIPIVFVTGDDPINIGLVTSFYLLVCNIIGIFFFFFFFFYLKKLELIREVVPNTGLIGVLVNPRNPQAESQARTAQVAARALGLSTLILNAGSENDFDMAFATLAQQQAGALLITGDALFTGQVDRLVALTVRQAVPAIVALREFAAEGVLMTYGASITEAYRQVGVYTGKILKGAKPAELPIMQPTTFELVINLKTAKSLGLEIPSTVLARADEVIE